MTVGKMHDDEVDIDASMVRRLLADQFPRWVDLPLERFPSAGTVNAIYRLGEHMCVRMPLVEKWAWGLKVEAKWLPRMRPHIPFAIPEPLGRGVPGHGYPLDWAVYRWIEGEPWHHDRIGDDGGAARDLADFITALQRVDIADTKPRVPRLAAIDEWIRQSIDLSRDMIDAAAVTAAWEFALQLPEFDGPYVWVHSDIGPGNLLVKGRRLHAVLDWASLHVGDPAHDYIGAWGSLGRDSRTLFRDAMGIDDATWMRALAWGLRSVGGIHYYKDTNRTMFENSLGGLAVVLDELRAAG